MKARYLLVVALVVPMAFGAEKKEQQRQQRAYMLSQGAISNIGQGGSSFKMKDTLTGETLTFLTERSTKVNIPSKIELADLKSGDEATVVYTRSGEKNLAAEINDMKVIAGKIESVEGTAIKIQDSRNQSEILKTSRRTSVSINGKKGQLAQLKEGDRCAAAVKQGSALYIDARRGSN